MVDNNSGEIATMERRTVCEVNRQSEPDELIDYKGSPD